MVVDVGEFDVDESSGTRKSASSKEVDVLNDLAPRKPLEEATLAFAGLKMLSLIGGGGGGGCVGVA